MTSSLVARRVCALMIVLLALGAAPKARAGFSIDATIPEAVYEAVTQNQTLGWAQTQRFSGDGARLIGAFEVGTSGNDDEAFVWSESEGVVLLGDFSGGRYDATPTGINADGSIIVGRSWGGTSNDPFVWDDVNGMQYLGTLPPGYNRARPTAVSDDGATVVGYLYKTTGPPEAFHWDAANGYTPLGTLPGGTQSEALAVSGDGSTVGGWGPVGGGDYEAFRWTAAGGLVALGDFTGSNHWSQGLVLSGDGGIVVGYGWKYETCGGQCGTSTTRAFRWTAAGGLEELGSWLDPTNVPISASSDASVVVGTAPNSEHFVWREGLGAEELEALFELESGTDIDDWEIEPLQVVDDGGAFAVLGVGRYLSDPPLIWRLRLDPPPACSDGLDNDGDGHADFPADPGCAQATSDDEAPACDDELDNDGDGGVDWDGGQGGGTPDPNCVAGWQGREAPRGCGLGFEVALLLAGWAALDRRRRRPRLG